MSIYDISLENRTPRRLKMITIVSVDDETINEHFPLDSQNTVVINEMALIAKSFKKQGRGSIQTKDNLYFYRTYTQAMSNNEEEKIFILIYTDSKYPSDIANKCLNEIIGSIKQNSFELSSLSKETKNVINNIFKTYEDGNNSKLYLRKIDSQSQIKNVDKPNDNMEGSLSLNFEAELKNAIQNRNNKEIKDMRGSNKCNPIINLDDESEIKIDGTQTNIKSSEIENDVDMTAMFLQENTALIKVKRWRKIKIFYIIVCVILALLAYASIPILVHFVKL